MEMAGNFCFVYKFFACVFDSRGGRCILGQRESKEWTSRGNVAYSRHFHFHKQDRREQNLATASGFECFAAKTRGGPDAESGVRQQILGPHT